VPIPQGGESATTHGGLITFCARCHVLVHAGLVVVGP
jgi:hypothetical protein